MEKIGKPSVGVAPCGSTCLILKIFSGIRCPQSLCDFLFFQLLNVRSLGIKRYEMEGQHVILYLDEIDKVSFSFKIYQSAVVKKTKPAAVTVYDYYETGKETDWRQKGVLYGENHLLYDFMPYSIHPKDHTPTTRPDHNTGNSVPYSFRTVHGFFYVLQNREQ